MKIAVAENGNKNNKNLKKVIGSFKLKKKIKN
jgi:hypothetical protein